IAFEKTEMIEKEEPVEVVHLVAKGPRQKIAAFEGDLLTVEIHSTQHNFFRTDNIRRKTWDAETALFFVLLSLGDDNLRIHDGQEMSFLLTSSCIRDHDSL